MTHLNTILDLYGFNEIQQEGLLDALKIVDCNIQVDESISSVEALDIFNEELQKSFLRPQGSERQQLSDKFENEREHLLPLLAPFIEEINTGNNVAHKILLGASESGVRERLNILVKLNNNTQVVYPLGGQRDLWPIAEPSTEKLVAQRLSIPKEEVANTFQLIFAKSIEMQNNRQNYIDVEFTEETNKARKESIEYFTGLGITWPTETDMMANLIEEYQIKLPGIEFKDVINAEKKLNAAGKLVRPDTLDTLIKMREIYEGQIPTQIAIVTTQPFGHYQQQQVIKAFNGLSIEILVVAEGANSAKVNLSTVFDSLARTIYAGKDIVVEKLKMREAEAKIAPVKKSFVERYLEEALVPKATSQEL
jgi:hypothetical protein